MKLTYNAPVILTLTLVAGALVGIDALTHGTARTLLTMCVITAVAYIGGELIASFSPDRISHLAHLIGGACDAGFGFLHAKARPPAPA